MILQNETYLSNPKKKKDKAKREKISHWVPFEENQPAFFPCGYEKKTKGTPLMHHKFMIFYNSSKFPYAATSGSHNPTETGNNSFENMCIFFDSAIAKHFEEEFLSVRNCIEKKLLF
jgi:hypothetical protein